MKEQTLCSETIKIMRIDTNKINKMNNLKNMAMAILIIPIITLASCSSKEDTREIIEMDPISVEVLEVNGTTQNSNFSVSGSIKPEKEANISTRMMGFITNVNVEVGDYVKKGKVLVEISSSDLKAKLAQVKANIHQAEVGVQNAKKDFDRMTKLFEQSSATEKELDDITTHYNMSKSGLDAARQMENEVNAQFAYTRIIAPFSGTVNAKYVNTGELANPGMPLLSIAKTEKYQAVGMVPENKISGLKKGQNATVWIKSLKKEIDATIDEIAISSKHTGGQFIVKLNLDKHTNQLYDGMYSTITFDESNISEQSSILIPEESLITQGSLKGVYTVGPENNAILRWLRLGKKSGDKYEVLSGLEGGERLVISSESRLYNGVPLTIQ